MRALIAVLLLVAIVSSCQDAPSQSFAAPAIQAIDSTDIFLGKVRKETKTSFADAPVDTFRDVKQLRNSFKDEEWMHKYSDARKQKAPRCKEEQKNVALTNVYLFAVSREDDNDFHLILGSNPAQGKNQVLISAEVSGLPDPASPHYAALKAVRDIFKNYFSDRYQKEHVFFVNEKRPPIKLEYLEGSLFFDNHHYNAYSGFNGFKAATAWEIHPVRVLRFAK
ncbi:MAG: hypothetical protein LW750_02135 [Bacteroidetes bacterium]|jgi:hypothetical protein|nr:hypothetical protein [Bacteroidota bacterium]